MPSSSGGRRLPLQFVVGGKSSQSVSSIILGKNSRIIKSKINTPTKAKNTTTQEQSNSNSNLGTKSGSSSACRSSSKVNQGQICEDHKGGNVNGCQNATSKSLVSGNKLTKKNNPAKKESRTTRSLSRKKVLQTDLKPSETNGSSKMNSHYPQTNQPSKMDGQHQEHQEASKICQEPPNICQEPPKKGNHSQPSKTNEHNQQPPMMDDHHQQPSENRQHPSKKMGDYSQPSKTNNHQKQSHKIDDHRQQPSSHQPLPSKEPPVLLPNKTPTGQDITQKKKKSQCQSIPAGNDVYADFTADSDDLDEEPKNSIKVPMILSRPKYTMALKSNSSAPSKKKLDSSIGSNVSAASNKSRTTLNDISNASIQRGGQKRIFTLSAAPKKKKNKKVIKKSSRGSSVCSSLNSTIISELELNAIPDSMPQKDDKNSSQFHQNASGKRQYKRVCLTTEDHHRDSLDSDSNNLDPSWEVPPKQKKPKKQIVSKKKFSNDVSKKAESSKVMLTSARTKKGPNSKAKARVSSFEITESDFEQDDFINRPQTAVKYKSNNSKTATNTSSKPSSCVPKTCNTSARARKKNDIKKPVTKDPEMSTRTTAPAPQPRNGGTARGNREKRVIDEIYNVVSPLPPPPVSFLSTTEVAGSDDHYVHEPQLSSKPLPSNCQLDRFSKITDSKRSSAKKLEKELLSPLEVPGLDIYDPQLSLEPSPSECTINHFSNNSKRPLKADGLPKAKKPRKEAAKPPEPQSKTTKVPQAVSSFKPTLTSTAKSLLQEFEDEEEEEDEKLLRKEDVNKSSFETKPPCRQLRKSSGYYSNCFDGYLSDSESSKEDSVLEETNNNRHFQSSHGSPLPNFPSPVASPLSLCSLQAEADEGITKGFEAVCHNLIAQSRKKDTREDTLIPAKAQAKAKIRKATKINMGEKRRDCEDEIAPAVTLTQISKVQF